MLQTETGLNVLRCSPVLAQLLMSLSCYSMSSFSLRHLLANEQWKTVSVAFHSAVVKLCIALCLDYNDIISFYKEHYNMPAAMYSKALSLSPSLPPAGLILLTHSSHASPSLRLNFHLLITWRSLTSSFYSLLSHLFCSVSTIGYATPPLPLPLLSSQYLVSKACTCLPGVTPPIYRQRCSEQCWELWELHFSQECPTHCWQAYYVELQLIHKLTFHISRLASSHCCRLIFVVLCSILS